MIAGLGNPGNRYARTRHSIGFQVVDRLAELNSIPLSSKRFKTHYGTGWINSVPVVLAKPLTFMNLSGEAVLKMVRFLGVEPEDLIVVHDDLDLAFGRLRIKRRGGDGGHQGVRSIIASLGSRNFLRLKVGVGRPPKGMEVSEYVLSPLEESQQKQVDDVLSRAAESLIVMIRDGVDVAMNLFQGRSSGIPHQ